jgi:hypothetical protein
MRTICPRADVRLAVISDMFGIAGDGAAAKLPNRPRAHAPRVDDRRVQWLF